MPSIRRHPKTNPAEHELEIDRQDMQFIFYRTLQDDETPSTIARLFYPSCTEQGLQLIINGNAVRYPGLEKGRKFKKGTLLVFPAAEIWLVCSQCGNDDDASALCLCDNVCGRAYCTSCLGPAAPPPGDALWHCAHCAAKPSPSTPQRQRTSAEPPAGKRRRSEPPPPADQERDPTWPSKPASAYEVGYRATGRDGLQRGSTLKRALVAGLPVSSVRGSPSAYRVLALLPHGAGGRWTSATRATSKA